MKNFSYSLTPTVHTNLQTIELLRRDILSTQLSPKTEMRLRFDTLVGRIQGICAFSGTPISKNDIVRELTFSTIKSKQAATATTPLRITFAYITYEWSINTRPVTYATLETIATLLGETSKIGAIYVAELAHSKDQMKNLLDFLATSKDHPIVTANVAFLQTMAIAPLGTKTAQFSFMLLFLFLYKYGYDLRSTITILPFWTHDLKTFQYTLVEAQTSGNFSKFIDFAIQQFAGELSEKRDTIPTSQLKFSATAALFTLTDRQKDILSRMDEPSVSVTNRAVQKQFGISQITASRDLARLSALGLLYPHGKGRSVYYTKV
jgi:hypothetical protein